MEYLFNKGKENEIEMNSTEIAIVKLKAGVSDEIFLKEAKNVQIYLQNSPGYVSRKLFKSQNGYWVDMVEWSSQENALKAFESFSKDSANHKFEELLDVSSMQMYHSSEFWKFE